jgi:hypothetical protein
LKIGKLNNGERKKELRKKQDTYGKSEDEIAEDKKKELRKVLYGIVEDRKNRKKNMK